MKNNEKFSIQQRLKSFCYAWNGFKYFISTEHNAWIHTAATLMVIGFGAYYKISFAEWIAISIAIALVFSSELLNTAIEKLCDIVIPEKSESIKHIKDLAAAAVLVCAMIAVVIALLVFIPKI